MNIKKKCIIVAEFPAPYRVKVFEELQKEYDLTVFFNCLNEKTRSKTYSLKKYNFNSFFLDTKIGKRTFNKALLHIKNYDFALAYNFVIVPGIRLCFRAYKKNIPLFYNADGGFIKHNFFKDIIKRKLIKICDLYFSSGLSADKYFLEFGGDKTKIRHHRFTSLNECDHINLSDVNKKTYKKELNLDPNKKYVISVGQFIPRKGFDLLLKNWRNIKDLNKELLIIGGGVNKNEYVEYIKENSMKNVTILDYMDKNILYKYYLASSLFILLTREDIWGLVINEAMNFGLPIITTTQCVAGNELIVNNENGYLINLVETTECYQLINKILDNDDLQKMMGINNNLKVKNESLERIAQEHIKNITLYFNEKRRK